MGSVPVDQAFNVDQQELDHVDHGMERNHWVLNSPEPPTPWQEILCCIRNTVFPPQKHKSNRKLVCSFLEGLFPILKWGRNYKASKFKNDLMAGLTLASLSIPQVLDYSFLIYILTIPFFFKSLIFWFNMCFYELIPAEHWICKSS